MSLPGPAPTFGPRRLTLGVAAACVIAAGLAARFLLHGGFADAAGGVLYTVLVYLLVGLLRPGWRPVRLAAIALAISCAVELLQLTGLPGALSAIVPPMRLVLGTTFSLTDPPAYVVGALLALAVDCLLRCGTRHPRPSRHDIPARSR
ncbi:ribosomal maturation YjgA family protein [Arthrobacter sp. AOP36-A1-22]|uniref:ribosomal maturation YjgA family protein n=1 Tax=unclassified Arthrobacter TaxID=235627 RepID=UPI004033326D